MGSQCFAELGSALEVNTVEADGLRAFHIFEAVVNEYGVGWVYCVSVEEGLINVGEGFSGLFGAGDDDAFEPMEEFVALPGDGEGFGAPVGEGQQSGVVLVAEVAQQFHGVVDGAAQHFCPTAVVGADF